MRTGLVIILLSLCGCQLWGGGGHIPFTQQQNCNGDCPSDAACRTCSPKSRTSEWLNRMTFGCFGHHEKYCRGHDNLMTRHDARKLAHRELAKCGHVSCGNCDFKKGFEQAFVDVSLGGDGDIPALPPATYWTNCARTPGGHEKAADWFEGYAAGAAAAKPFYEPYNKVAASQFEEVEWGQQ